MKAAIYARVSTDKQEIETQLNPLLDFCKKRGFEIYKVYKDTASGKTTNHDAFNE
ncbi:MAG: recombinase family protein [Elusimicrobia bacterium]|nr:recombinase family protein [Elusimicrobiota bacterium]